ncbi:hypothetical protein Pfo_021936, partial [Paulownia fortunei]
LLIINIMDEIWLKINLFPPPFRPTVFVRLSNLIYEYTLISPVIQYWVVIFTKRFACEVSRLHSTLYIYQLNGGNYRTKITWWNLVPSDSFILKNAYIKR